MNVVFTFFAFVGFVAVAVGLGMGICQLYREFVGYPIERLDNRITNWADAVKRLSERQDHVGANYGDLWQKTERAEERIKRLEEGQAKHTTRLYHLEEAPPASTQSPAWAVKAELEQRLARTTVQLDTAIAELSNRLGAVEKLASAVQTSNTLFESRWSKEYQAVADRLDRQENDRKLDRLFLNGKVAKLESIVADAKDQADCIGREVASVKEGLAND